MTAGDVGYIVFGIGLMGAFVDAATGCQIAKALRKVLRGKAPHLRGRKPAECGWGTPSETQLQEVVRVERFANRRGSGDDLSGWDNVVRSQMRQTQRARDWLDSALEAHTAPRPESFEEYRSRQASGLANRLPDVREQTGLADARAFQKRHWDAQVSPLDRARLAAWSASLRGEEAISLPLDQYHAALGHYCAERVWRDPSESPHLYGVRLAAKVV